MLALMHYHPDYYLFLAYCQEKLEQIKQERVSQVKADMIFTQAISVIIFERNSSCHSNQIDNSQQQIFSQLPWKFHHITGTSENSHSTRKMLARQEYYELHKDLPLFSIGSVHFGKPIRRISLFTCNQTQMINFYRKLLHIEPTAVRDDFCFFALGEVNGARMQFSLKSSQNIMVYPLALAQLTFTLKHLPSDIGAEKVDKEYYRIYDPDNNPILVRIAIPETEVQSCDLIKESCLAVEEYIPVKQKERKMEAKRHCKSANGEDTEKKPWPDVIPDEDNLPKPKSLTPTYVKLRSNLHSGSPRPVRKLNITTSNVCNEISMTEKDLSASMAMKARGQETVNIQETF